jgi:hypothetical protein
VAYEDVVGELKCLYTDHQLAPAYQLQIKARIHLSGYSLQEITASVKQLANEPLLGYLRTSYRGMHPMHLSMEKDREVKQCLFMGSERSLNEALNQVLCLRLQRWQPKYQGSCEW